MTMDVFERFLVPGERLGAVAQLIARDDAVPLLVVLFNGEARNGFGSPYRDIGALPCGLEAAARLADRAKPLEIYLRDAALAGWPRAATALGSLGALEDASVDALVHMLAHHDVDVQAEAVAALIRNGLGDLPSVLRLRESSEQWRILMSQMQSREI